MYNKKSLLFMTGKVVRLINESAFVALNDVTCRTETLVSTLFLNKTLLLLGLPCYLYIYIYIYIYIYTLSQYSLTNHIYDL